MDDALIEINAGYNIFINVEHVIILLIILYKIILLNRGGEK